MVRVADGDLWTVVPSLLLIPCDRLRAIAVSRGKSRRIQPESPKHGSLSRCARRIAHGDVKIIHLIERCADPID